MSMKCSALALLLALASLQGCSSLHSRPAATEVAQGQRFSTTNREYDQFFSAVHRLQLTMAQATDELSAARRELTHATVFAKDAGSSAIASQVKLELDRLAKRGVYVRVELERATPDTASHARASFSPANKPAQSDEALLKKLESGVTGMLRVSASMQHARAEISVLASQAERLEHGLEVAYGDASRAERERVLDNLRDAERVLALTLARAERTGKPADEFVQAFVAALGHERRAIPIPEPEAPPPSEQETKAPVEPPRQHKPAGSARDKKKGAEPATRSEFDP